MIFWRRKTLRQAEYTNSPCVNADPHIWDTVCHVEQRGSSLMLYLYICLKKKTLDLLVGFLFEIKMSKSPINTLFWKMEIQTWLWLRTTEYLRIFSFPHNFKMYIQERSLSICVKCFWDCSLYSNHLDERYYRRNQDKCILGDPPPRPSNIFKSQK